jgi:uncharacterized oxidoreductase
LNTRGNSILITGGATGIGFSLAQIFMENGNQVLICGRREDKLLEAKSKLPQLQVKVCDVSKEKERESLYSWVKDNFGDINMLVNNAGIQKMIDFKNGTRDLSDGQKEIEINLMAPVHLSALFIPLFMKQNEAAIINISSSLAFKPMPHIPLYCVSKAAIHAFSMVLREQLKDTLVKVFEIVAPLVDTELDRGSRENRKVSFRGIPPIKLVRPIVDAVAHDEYEIVVGEAVRLVSEGKKHIEEMLQHHKIISIP